MIYRQKVHGHDSKGAEKDLEGGRGFIGPEGKFYRRKHRPRG